MMTGRLDLGGSTLERAVVDKAVRSLATESGAATPEGLRLVHQLLVPANCSFDVVAGADHPTKGPPIGRRTYVHEEASIRYLRKLFPNEADQVVDSRWDADPRHSVISVGAGISNPFTRQYLGNDIDPKHSVKVQDRRVKLKYAIAAIEGAFTSRSQDSTEYVAPQRGIVDSMGNILARSTLSQDSNRLAESLLMITRIPHGKSITSDLVFITGAHGPATSAMQVLWSLLRQEQFAPLVRQLGEWRHFQAVFRVLDFYEELGDTMASAIAVERACPPIQLTLE